MNLLAPFLFLWPGSTGTLRYGLWDHLGIATIFGVACQGVVVLSFTWTDFLFARARVVLLGSLVLLWVVLSAVAHNRLKKYEQVRDVNSTCSAFLEAQSHYLRGNWFEAEVCLNAILRRNPSDSEALLLLATLFRHIKRFQEARDTLATLEKLSAADFWRQEIIAEYEFLKEDEKEALKNAQESSSEGKERETD